MRRFLKMRAQLLLLITLLTPWLTSFANDRIQVFVSVLPQATFVQEIGGSRVEVEALVGPGYSPHAYEPTPGQMTRLSEARLYLGIGLPDELAWKKRILAVNPTIRFADLSEGIERRRIEEHADHGSHRHGGTPGSEQDPHLWTSPRIVMQLARRIAAELAAMDPGHASEYQERLSELMTKLERLDADIRSELAGLAHRSFMVYHPAWGYFADAYGLTQIPIELEGKEPGPKRLATLIDEARRSSLRVILAQPQMSTKAAKRLAGEIGGHVEVVDILSPDYFRTMRRLAQVLASADR